MPVDYSLIPTGDLLAFRNMDYSAVSTATLRYLKTGNASVIGGAARAVGRGPAGRAAPGPDRIERSTGAGIVDRFATSSERPRETILGVEGVPAQGSDIRPQFRRAPGFLKRAGEDIAAVEDIPGTLVGQAIAFPASKVGGAAAALGAAASYPADWLVSKLSHGVKPPRNPLEAGQDAERGIHDFIAQPGRPRAELTTDTLETLNDLPPLRLMNKAFEATQGARNYLAGEGYPTLGYAVGTAGDLGLLWLTGRGAKELGREGIERGGAKGAAVAGKGPRLPSGAEVERAIRLGEPISAEHMRAYPDLLKKYERSFVRTWSGSTDFGVIDKRISPDLPEGPIRLQRGNEGFGEFHIETKRGNMIRSKGFSDSTALLEDTIKGATQMWEGPNGRLLLVKKNGKDYITVVEFQRTGDFYSVVTAFPTRDARYAAKLGSTLVYEGQPLGSLWGGK